MVDGLDGGKLATFRVRGNELLKTTDGSAWRVIFTYNNLDRLREICHLLNESAIGQCSWLRKELKGEPQIVLGCDDCPLYGGHFGTCNHPKVAGKSVADAVWEDGSARTRPDWCPLIQAPLYLKTLTPPV